MYHDDVVLPHPPVTRGLQGLVERISKEMPEISIVPFEAYKYDEVEQSLRLSIFQTEESRT